MPRAAADAEEAMNLAAQEQIRDRIDDHLGAPIDIAAPCGLGRRSHEAAEANLHRVAELTTP